MKRSSALWILPAIALMVAQPLAQADKGKPKEAYKEAYFVEKELSADERQFVREVNQACGRGDTDEVPQDPTRFKCPRTSAGAQKLIQLGKDPRAQASRDLRDFAFFAANVMAGKSIVGAQGGGNEKNALSVENAKAFNQSYQCEADQNGIRLTPEQSGLRYHPVRLSSKAETECVECNAKKKDAAISSAGLSSSLVGSIASGNSGQLTQEQFRDVEEKGWTELKTEVREHSSRILMERLRTEAFLMGFLHSGDGSNAKNSQEFAKSVIGALTCNGKTSTETAANRRANEEIYRNVEKETGKFFDGEVGAKRRETAQRAHMQTVAFAAACREAVGSRINDLRKDFGLGANELQKYQELIAASYKSPVAATLKKGVKSFGSMLGDIAYSFRPVVAPLVLTKLPGYPNASGGHCSEFYRTQAYRSTNQSPENQECQKKLVELQALDSEIRAIDAAHSNLSVVLKDGELLSQKLTQTSRVMEEFPGLKSYRVDVMSPEPQSCMSQLQTPVEGGVGLKAWRAQDLGNSDYQATVRLYRDFVAKEAVKKVAANHQALCQGDQDSLTTALLQSPAFSESFYSCNRPSSPLLAYYASLQDQSSGPTWPTDARTQGDPNAGGLNACKNRRSSTWVACSQARWEVDAQKSRTILAGVEGILGESMSMGGVGSMIPGLGLKTFASQGVKSMTRGLAFGAGFGAGFHVAVVEPQLKQARAQAAQALQSVDLGFGDGLTRAEAEQTLADLPGWMEAVVPGAILGGVAEVSLSKVGSDLAAKSMAQVSNRVGKNTVRLSRFERDAFKQAWEQLKSKTDLVSDEQKILNRILDGKEPITQESAHVLEGLALRADEIMSQKRQDFESNLGKLMSRIDAKRTALKAEMNQLERLSSRTSDQEKRLGSARKELAQLEKELGPETLGDRARAFLGLKDKRLLSYWDGSLKGERGEFLQLMSEFERLGCSALDFRTFVGFVETNCNQPQFKNLKWPKLSAKCGFSI